MADFFVLGDDGYMHIDVDPDSTDKYTWDWTKWLAERGSVGIQAPPVITLDTGLVAVGIPTVSSGRVIQVIQVTGTLGDALKAKCSITTLDSPALHDDLTMVLDLVQK